MRIIDLNSIHITQTPNRVLELVPVARLVLVDLEAATLGALREPALDEDEEKKDGDKENEVEVMEREVVANAAASEPEPAPIETTTEDKPAVEMIVIPSQTQTQEEAARPAAPHPRVPGKWEAAEFSRMARWVLDLPLPPQLDAEDMERGALKKAYGKLLVRMRVHSD